TTRAAALRRCRSIGAGTWSSRSPGRSRRGRRCNMSNWIAMRLDVLAPNPEEINKIEAALQQPCQELLEGVAEDIRSIVRFTPVGNLGFLDPSSNTARQFQN